MKAIHIFIVLIIIMVANGSCRKKSRVPEATTLGTITVDLDANPEVIRKRESLIGNFICDAIAKKMAFKGKAFDFVLVNSGNIRFSSSIRPSGIYPAGPVTDKMADEMLPFGDESVIVKLNGKQLKEVFERSIAQYPLNKGPFMQLSNNIKIIIDTTKNPQTININQDEIINTGHRITSIKINNTDLDTFAIYTVVLPSYIAEGNDGYVTLKKLSASLKETVADEQVNAVKELLINDGTVTPVLEGRIIFQ